MTLTDLAGSLTMEVMRMVGAQGEEAALRDDEAHPHRRDQEALAGTETGTKPGTKPKMAEAGGNEALRPSKTVTRDAD